MTEIPEEALTAAGQALADEAGLGNDCGFDAQWRRRTARFALAAALPHLRVQETPEASALDVIAAAVGSQDAHLTVDCDIHEPLPRIYARAVAAALEANGYRITPATPAPRPVVDRGAIWRALYDVWQNPKERPIDFASEGADAILALLPTEEGPSGQEHPQRSDPAATQDPEQAPHTGHRPVREPARPADAEELAQARPATGLTEEDTKGEGS